MVMMDLSAEQQWSTNIEKRLVEPARGRQGGTN